MNSLFSICLILTLTFTLVQLYELRDDSEKKFETNFIRANSECNCHHDPCWNGPENYNVSCWDSNAVYFNCKQSSCKVEYCPLDQMFKDESESCEFCPEGLETAAHDGWFYCRCPRGNYLDSNNQCVPCKIEKPPTEWNCDCLGMGLDGSTNTCRKCPKNSLPRMGQCLCVDSNLFWSATEFKCKECPGNLVDDKLYGFRCHCPGENKMFNHWSATCITCPSNTVSVHYSYGNNQDCDCLENGKEFHHRWNTCV